MILNRPSERVFLICWKEFLLRIWIMWYCFERMTFHHHVFVVFVSYPFSPEGQLWGAFYFDLFCSSIVQSRPWKSVIAFAKAMLSACIMPAISFLSDCKMLPSFFSIRL